jgi:hypothetical protein
MRVLETFKTEEHIISTKFRFIKISNICSWDSIVGIVTSYGVDDRQIGVQVLVGKNFLFSMLSRPALGSTQLPIQWVPVALAQGVMWLGRKADHSPAASAKVKKM